jgi:hypothetical protein
MCQWPICIDGQNGFNLICQPPLLHIWLCTFSVCPHAPCPLVSHVFALNSCLTLPSSSVPCTWLCCCSMRPSAPSLSCPGRHLLVYAECTRNPEFQTLTYGACNLSYLLWFCPSSGGCGPFADPPLCPISLPPSVCHVLNPLCVGYPVSQQGTSPSSTPLTQPPEQLLRG